MLTDIQSSVDLVLDDLRAAQDRIRDTLQFQRDELSMEQSFALLQCLEIIGNAKKQIKPIMED